MSKYTIEHKDLKITVWEKSIRVESGITGNYTKNLYFNPANEDDIFNLVEGLISLGKQIKMSEIKKMLEIHN